MNKFLVVSFCLLTIRAWSQHTIEPKAVLNSVITLDEPINDFRLISNYYPLKSNIENRNSMIFVSDTPTLDQIENTAINTTSDFFYISKNNVVINKLMLINKPVRNYYIVSPQTGNQDEIECKLTGDITENRANELVAEKYDSCGLIQEDELFFNNKWLKIIPTKTIHKDILNIISQYQLSNIEALKPKPIKKPATSKPQTKAPIKKAH